MEAEKLFDYILRWADSSLILGQRIAECCGHGPVLEEDIALTNISLDLIGQARSLLTHAGNVERLGRDEDQLAFFRDVTEYRNPLLVELPNGHFGDTIARQFVHDHFLFLCYREMQKSKDIQLSAIAEKSIKEVAYHRKHSSDWVVRLGDGTEESHNKIQESINDIWTYTGELFTMDDIELQAVKEGIGVDVAALKDEWRSNIEEVMKVATLTTPEDGWMQKGGKQGIHTEYLGYILAEMQHIPRMHPNAEW
ncbi:MAG: phenylacetate-CoA oxygenase subunit PaaC, partial [Flavobacteriales bacterium]|nr:phenylacetate-CoA oxygenase subunit PaaC [Flavobacteriales bacterium]